MRSRTGRAALAAMAIAVAAAGAGTAPPAAGAAGKATAPPDKRAVAGAPASERPIDVNSATRAQLKALPGIGDAEAERIVEKRPYLSKADLVSRQVIPAGVYQSIRQRIIAVQKAPEKKKQRRMSNPTAASNPRD